MKSETYLYVQYKDSLSQWIYKCDGTFYVGDIVEAPTFKGAIINVGIVKRIVRLKDEELTIEKEKILTITKKLDKKQYEKDFHPLEFMKKYIRRDYLKEWRFAGENDWAKFYESSFDGEISYEQDGVLICSLGDCRDKNYFQEYTITNTKYFDLKIKYLQTTLTELYYKKITEQEFVELLNVVSKYKVEHDLPF